MERLSMYSTLPNCLGFCRLVSPSEPVSQSAFPFPQRDCVRIDLSYALHARSVSHRLPMLTRETNRDAQWEEAAVKQLGLIGP